MVSKTVSIRYSTYSLLSTGDMQAMQCKRKKAVLPTLSRLGKTSHATTQVKGACHAASVLVERADPLWNCFGTALELLWNCLGCLEKPAQLNKGLPLFASVLFDKRLLNCAVELLHSLSTKA